MIPEVPLDPLVPFIPEVLFIPPADAGYKNDPILSEILMYTGIGLTVGLVVVKYDGITESS